MTSWFLLERRREDRRRRFGFALGVAIAVPMHAALIWISRADYRPASEHLRFRRALVARPYEPVRPPAPTPPQPAPPRQAESAEALAAAPRSEPSPPQAPSTPSFGGADLPRAGPPAPANTDIGRPVGGMPPDQADRGRMAPAGPDAWSAVLSELESRHRSLSAEAERGRQEAARATGGRDRGGQGSQDDAEGDGYLDPRIRMKVVSYPPTAIDSAHPPIPYPDLRFHRSQLQSGICRVYYRVWTDGRGRVTRRQIKTPDTKEALALYGPFVDAVTRSVDEWPFDAAEAEVHVDVLFEIE